VGGRRRSTIDLFDARLTLVTGPHGDRWVRDGQDLAAAGIPVVAYRAGVDLTDLEGQLTERYGLGADGCVLVRPDGYVAWSYTSGDTDHPGALREHVDSALGPNWAHV
jgi:hypothetical protein